MADRIDSAMKIDGHSQMGEGVRDHDDATREGRACRVRNHDDTTREGRACRVRAHDDAAREGRACRVRAHDDAAREGRACRVRAHPRSRRSVPLPPPARGAVEPAASEAKDGRLTSR